MLRFLENPPREAFYTLWHITQRRYATRGWEKRKNTLTSSARPSATTTIKYTGQVGIVKDYSLLFWCVDHAICLRYQEHRRPFAPFAPTPCSAA